MMRIACLGWGSLIWDHRDLPIESTWHDDGPLIQVEFLRQSKDGRITLVLDESAKPVQSFWTFLRIEDIDSAKKALQKREGINEAKTNCLIGSWFVGQAAPRLIDNLPEWAAENGVDGVIWTALPPRFNGCSIPPTQDQVIEYLNGLTGKARENAERYIRKAPSQIATKYRQSIESRLGWTPSDA